MDLQTLKQKLLNDKDLAPVYSYFLDHFGENPKFMALGDPAQLSLLEGIVGQIVQQMVPRGGAIQGLRLTRLADERFVHGGFHVGSRMGGVIYFEECQTGLVVLSESSPGTDAKFARFKATIVAPDPSRN